MRERLSVRLPTALIQQLDDISERKRISRAILVETAIASYLSPDGADQLEAALARRLDRMSRELERLQRHSAITNETLALFVRFWLTHTPPLPDTARPAAQSKGRERYEGFVEALGRRLARGKSLLDEIKEDPAQPAGDTDD